MSMSNYRFHIIFIIFGAFVKNLVTQDVIPGEQFKINNFQEDIWHPHLEKSQLDDTNFVLVDTYKEHLTASTTPDRLQSIDNAAETRSYLNANYVIEDEGPDTILPGQDPTVKGPFN